MSATRDHVYANAQANGDESQRDEAEVSQPESFDTLETGTISNRVAVSFWFIDVFLYLDQEY